MQIEEQKNICLMIPTYKRVGNLQKIIDSALKHADDVSRLRFSFCVNDRDTETVRYLSERYWPHEMYWEIVFEQTQQPNLALYFNLMFEKSRFANNDTMVSMIGDDMTFESFHWDSAILEAVNRCGGHAIIYLNDNFIAGATLCVNLFVPRQYVLATELSFMCPRFHAEMIDVVWMNIGQTTGTIFYLNNIVLQHNHAMRLPEELQDETFKRLAPLRSMYGSSRNNVTYAMQYAHVASANLIRKGVGQWNVLAPQK